jgi:hypothetical protein
MFRSRTCKLAAILLSQDWLITHGGCSTQVLQTVKEVVAGKTAAEVLKEAGY